MVTTSSQSEPLFYYKKYLKKVQEALGQQTVSHSKPVSTFVSIKPFKPFRFFIFICRTLLQIPKILVELYSLPHGCSMLFNHTGRVRKSSSGSSFLYVDDLPPTIDHFILVNDSPSSVRIPSNASVFSKDSIEDLAILLSTWIRWFNKVQRKSFDRIEVEFWSRVALWTAIFKYLTPSKIILIVFYGKESIIGAAKQQGIPVYDIQHGAIFEQHPIYNIKDGLNIAQSDFTLPDACWVYGEYWRKQLLKSGWDSRKIKIVGYYLDTSKKQDCSRYAPYLFYPSPVHDWLEVVNHINVIKPEAKRRGFKILISPHPHPTEDLLHYHPVLDDTVMIISDCDSYDLLRNCHVLMSTYSTLLFEAMIFSKSAYILNSSATLPDFVNDLIQMGLAKPIHNTDFPEPFLISDENRKYFFDDVCSNLFL